MENIKKYSPHVYLHQVGENSYSLFVTIFAFEGQTVQLMGTGEPYYYNGSTIVQYQISGTEPNEGPASYKTFHFQQLLNPANGAQSSFDPETFSIRIEASYYPVARGGGPADHNSIVLFYQDADDGEVSVEQNIAIQSPYVYLNNPMSESGSVSNVFDPYCLIYVKHCTLNDVEVETENGTYTQKLYFIPNDAVDELQMVPILSIPSNTMDYQDVQYIDGYFETEVIYFKGTPPKKGKIRNVSADGNNSNFMDRPNKPQRTR